MYACNTERAYTPHLPTPPLPLVFRDSCSSPGQLSPSLYPGSDSSNGLQATSNSHLCLRQYARIIECSADSDRRWCCNRERKASIQRIIRRSEWLVWSIGCNSGATLDTVYHLFCIIVGVLEQRPTLGQSFFHKWLNFLCRTPVPAWIPLLSPTVSALLSTVRKSTTQLLPTGTSWLLTSFWPQLLSWSTQTELV